ncbi:serine hydrolase domain-containing protein [Plantactinospora sp. B5E13]|uniref:serine hydrolase domain-containing protein n=1 Tax=Plantactinospora sp. B5E13 TaxID=3153758 RepID=UPI00325D6833
MSRRTPGPSGIWGTGVRPALAVLILVLLVGVPAAGPASANPAAAGPAAGEPGAGAPYRGDPDAGRIAEATAYLRRHMADTRTPGLAYAIVHRDRVVAQGAWGVDGAGHPVTVDTPFLLGSLSKSFTALAVMQLVEAGRVDLDSPARRYVPWLRLADEGVAARITVRQLLTHTTGLPQIMGGGLADRYDNAPGGLTRLVRDLASLRSTMPPGGRYQYSNANYAIAGVLVEEVTGQPYGSYLRQHVLDPLGMTRSAATAAEARAVDLPAGHRYHFGHPRRVGSSYDTSGVPYGYLAVSLTDVTHYAIAQLNDGRYGEHRVLSAQGVAQLHTGRVGTGGDGKYGLGWREHTFDDAGGRIVWHAGATPEFFSHLVLVPGSELAVMVLSNTYSLGMDGPLASAAFNVARILHGNAPVTTPADPLLGGTLVGLLVVVGLLLGLLVWSMVRLVRRRGGTWSTRRVVVVTTGWVVGCVALGVGALWGLPAAFDGATLAVALRYTMDIGHLVIAVAVLAGLLALARIGLGLRMRG